MNIRKSFHIIVLISLLMSSIITPAMAGDESQPLSSGARLWDKGILTAPQAPTATYTVCASGCDFSSIQAAIDFATDGDIIDLASEIYTETITIDKDISLIGDGADNTVLQAAGAPGIATSSVVSLWLGVNATLEGLTIRYGNDIDNGGGINYPGEGVLTRLRIICCESSR